MKQPFYIKAAALLMLGAALTACGDVADTALSSTDTEVGIPETAETALLRENIPDSIPQGTDLGGRTIRIPYRDFGVYAQELFAEQTADVVDDAVYNRNRAVEERLNVTLELMATDHTIIGDEIRKTVVANEDAYDLIAGPQWVVLPQALEGFYIDYNEVATVDLSAPWWWNAYIDEIKIGSGPTYFLNGDISLSSIQLLSAIFVNKKLVADLGYSIDDIYQTVLDGDWTYDKLKEVCAKAYRDINGDGVRGREDAYGCIVRVSTEPVHFTYTAGNVMYERDADNLPHLNVNNEHFINYMTQLYDLYFNEEGIYPEAATDEAETYMIDSFKSDRSVFLVTRLQRATNLRDMTSEYGIIPYPKYDDTQKEYSALVHDSASIYCIPVTAHDIDEIGTVLEAMCAQSYRTVVPAYYETALKTKYVSDSTTGQIIDLIRAGAKTDFVYAYNYALSGAGMLSASMLQEKSTNFASSWAKIEKSAEKGLQELIDLYSEMGE